MPPWIGSFSSSGSPTLKVAISGPFGDGLEYEATIDTGFTGFLSIPLGEAIRLGLILYGTTSVTFANGETSFRLTAKGKVKVGEEYKIGVAVLEWKSTEVLLGIGFLRQFQKAMLISQYGVVLEAEIELEKADKSVSASGPIAPAPDSTSTQP
jgi:clan AA aspartic protease